MKLKFYMRGLGIGILVTAGILALSGKGNNANMTDEQVRARAKELGMIENTVLKTNDEDLNVNEDKELSVQETDVSSNKADENLVADNNENRNDINQKETDNKDSGTKDNAEKKDDPMEVPTSEPTKEPTKMPTEEPTKAPTAEPTKAPTEEPTKAPTAEPTKAPTASPEVVATPEGSINVNNGMVTVTIVKGDSSFSVAKKVVAAGLAESAADFDQFLCENNYDKTLSVGNHKIPVNATWDQIGKILVSREN